MHIIQKMKVELVKATEKDKHFLFELRQLTMVEHLRTAGIHLTEDQHLSRINIYFDSCFIIKTSSQKIGMLKCLEERDFFDIKQLQVMPDYQGMGIGKQVLDIVLSKATSMKKEVRLKVLKQNPARYLYERNGFVITGEDEYEFYMTCNMHSS